MKRVIFILGCILLICAEAAADCAEEVTEAWGRLLKTPFSFETTYEGEANAEIAGSFIWPLALHYSLKNGLIQDIFVGSRHWSYSNGAWTGGGGYEAVLGTPDRALALYWMVFGFETLPLTGQGVASAVCLGQVKKDGREYSLYEYSVPKGLHRNVIFHQKLYVDTLSGLPARQEVEREFVKPIKGSRARHSTKFRPDPLLKIEPPG
jgi:hypothetical protein